MSPFWVEFIRYVVVAIIGAIGSIIVVKVSSKLQKRGQTMDNSQKSYDQLQEDNDGFRSQIKDLTTRMDQYDKKEAHIRAEANRVVDEARQQTYLLQDEINILRRGIEDGSIPPLPDRKQWSLFPVPNFNLPGGQS